jgi:hypothetical protein
MAIDWNNFEQTTAYVELLEERFNRVDISVWPLPVRNGNPLPDGYVFSEDDLYLPEGITKPTDITESDINARVLLNAWNRVRYERDDRLKDTDVWAFPDRTMTDAQKSYRQALRDITKQSDPYNVTWPTKPS